MIAVSVAFILGIWLSIAPLEGSLVLLKLERRGQQLLPAKVKDAERQDWYIFYLQIGYHFRLSGQQDDDTSWLLLSKCLAY